MRIHNIIIEKGETEDRLFFSFEANNDGVTTMSIVSVEVGTGEEYCRENHPKTQYQVV